MGLKSDSRILNMSFYFHFIILMFEVFSFLQWVLKKGNWYIFPILTVIGIATRSPIKTIVIASHFSMHKRPVATDFDYRLVAMVI